MRKGGARLLMVTLAVDNDGVGLPAYLLTPLPDLFHKRTCRVVSGERDTARVEGRLYLQRRAKRRDDDDIFGREDIKREQRIAFGIGEELDTAVPQILVDARVMNNLGEQENPFVRILF